MSHKLYYVKYDRCDYLGTSVVQGSSCNPLRNRSVPQLIFERSEAVKKSEMDKFYKDRIEMALFGSAFKFALQSVFANWSRVFYMPLFAIPVSSAP